MVATLLKHLAELRLWYLATVTLRCVPVYTKKVSDSLVPASLKSPLDLFNPEDKQLWQHPYELLKQL